jgi:hypothetical protein
MDTGMAVSPDWIKLAFRLHSKEKARFMKRSQAIALTALTTALAAGLTTYFLSRRKHAKRKAFVSNAGYEMAYDIHYPPKYSRHSRQHRQNRSDRRNGHHSSAN